METLVIQINSIEKTRALIAYLKTIDNVVSIEWLNQLEQKIAEFEDAKKLGAAVSEPNFSYETEETRNAKIDKATNYILNKNHELYQRLA